MRILVYYVVLSLCFRRKLLKHAHQNNAGGLGGRSPPDADGHSIFDTDALIRLLDIANHVHACLLCCITVVLQHNLPRHAYQSNAGGLGWPVNFRY